MSHPKITVCIPAFNSERTILETLNSVDIQDYPKDLMEILVIDDASMDNTVAFVKCFENVRLIKNEKNLGIGKNLVKLINEAKGKYLFFLCADDIITHPKVISDYVSVFDKQTDIGVISRYFYFFMDGYPGAIGTCRDTNILTSSCCPSGIGLRKIDGIKATNKIFIEMPYIVLQYLEKWRWTMIEYDTIAARFSPGNNTGTKSSYYAESPTQNWIDLLQQPFNDFPMFIQLKNRAPHLLWGEICLAVESQKKNLINIKFWLYAIVAIFTPSMILRHLTNWYRHRVARLSAKIIERPN